MVLTILYFLILQDMTDGLRSKHNRRNTFLFAAFYMGQATATLILKIVLALQRKPPCASKLVNSSTPLLMHSQCPYSVQAE